MLGKKAGHINNRGYEAICIGRKIYRAHRLAWVFVYGVIPKEIDHINGIRSDNRIVNLRECSSRQNSYNRKKVIATKTSSVYKGVCWSSYHRKWIARITINGKDKHLGAFINADDAWKAYKEKARELHGAFYREGA